MSVKEVQQARCARVPEFRPPHSRRAGDAERRRPGGRGSPGRAVPQRRPPRSPGAVQDHQSVAQNIGSSRRGGCAGYGAPPRAVPHHQVGHRFVPRAVEVAGGDQAATPRLQPLDQRPLTIRAAQPRAQRPPHTVAALGHTLRRTVGGVPKIAGGEEGSPVPGQARDTLVETVRKAGVPRFAHAGQIERHGVTRSGELSTDPDPPARLARREQLGPA